MRHHEQLPAWGDRTGTDFGLVLFCLLAPPVFAVLTLALASVVR